MITFRPDIYFISFSTLATPQNQNPKVIIIGRWVGETGQGIPVMTMIALQHKLETGPNVFAPPNSVWAIRTRGQMHSEKNST